MPRFVALPVTRGDAFYLEYDHRSILVDGGMNRKALPGLFRDKTGTDGVNVLVCTHNDADHAEGVVGFLGAGLRCDEVWLPGRWASVLPDVLGAFGDVYAQILRDIAIAEEFGFPEKYDSGFTPLETLAERRWPQLNDEVSRAKEIDAGESGWPESIVEAVEESESWGEGVWGPGRRLLATESSILDLVREMALSPEARQLLWNAIDAASRIREIARQAYLRGIPVRWFQYDSDAPSGGNSEIQPLNARAVTTVRIGGGLLLYRLALSVANKESLVFWSPPSDHHPGVLFNADSDLARVKLPLLPSGTIATAPHHGSESNAVAYAAVAKAAGIASSNIVWVRSDGRCRRRPGPTYVGLAHRHCTICRRGPGSWSLQREVLLVQEGGAWALGPGTVRCSCK